MNKGTVVITGGSSGIGLASVTKFISENYQVIVLDIAEPPLYELSVEYIKCDLNSVDEIKESFKTISSRHKEIVALINSAGLL